MISIFQVVNMIKSQYELIYNPLELIDLMISDSILIAIAALKQCDVHKSNIFQQMAECIEGIGEINILLIEGQIGLEQKLLRFEQMIIDISKGEQEPVIDAAQFYATQESKVKMNFQDEYIEMNQFYEEEVIEINTDLKATCNICLENMDLNEIWPLSCGHIFHRSCLNKYGETQINDRTFPIKCPEVSCKQEISYNDLSECLDDIQMNYYSQYQLNKLIETHQDEYSWCPTPDCKYVFIANGTYFNCQLCKKEYCLACRCEFHQNMNCQQYRASLKQKEQQQLDDQFLNFVKGAKFKQCPNCKFWVEKNQGCNHMTCRCKYQFCYVCGGKYKQCACR